MRFIDPQLRNLIGQHRLAVVSYVDLGQRTGMCSLEL